MGAPETADLLDGAVAAIDRLLQSPEWLLDPTSQEARDAAKEARGFMKHFHDEVHSHRSEGAQSAALGLGSLVVDGFDRHQIWEELEVQNVPLRRHLRRLLPKFTRAARGVVDVGVSAPAPAAASAAPGPAAAEERQGRAAARRRPAGKAKARRRAEDAREEGPAGDAGEDADGAEEAEAPADDGRAPADFFDKQEMERFTSLGDEGKLRLDPDAGESDFDELEADDEDASDVETAKNACFADFYLPSSRPARGEQDKSRRRGQAAVDKQEAQEDGDGVGEGGEDDEQGEQGEEEEEEEEEAGDADGGEEDDGNLSEEEAALEAEIQKLQQDGAGDDDDDEDGASEAGSGAGLGGQGSEEGESEDEEGQDGEEDAAEAEGARGRSLYEMDKRLRSLEEEVAKLEEEQLEAKPWTLQGEVSAKERPLNSLLEVHLDQPMTHFAGRRAEDAAIAAGGVAEGEAALDDVAGAEGLAKQEAFDIEAVIRQRIWDEMFDDVVRKTALPPSQRAPTASDEIVENLNFEKSRVGLGDVYAKQYETEMLGHASDAKVKEDKEKTETKELFSKLMHKLDLLTNAHFTPRPPMLGASGEQLEKVASLKMEETIPLLVSDASLKAPEELRAPRRHNRGREELSHEERVAARRNKKAMRKKKLERRVEGGEMTLQGLRERGEKLSAKNAEKKREKERQGEVREQKKRLKASELLEQAARNATNQASRKDEQRRERQKRPADAPTSKRLKL